MPGSKKTSDAFPAFSAISADNEAQLTSLEIDAFLQAAQHSSLGLAVVDDSGSVNYANPTFTALLGLTEHAIRRQPLLDRCEMLSPAERAALSELLARTENGVLTLPRSNGTALILTLDARHADSRLIVVTRAGEHTVTFEADQQLSLNDPHTGLGNRLAFEEAVARWMACHPDNQTLAVLLIDLDRFKQVNETLGHLVGDALLKLAARRLKNAAHDNDQVMRLSGDEFVILHPLEPSHDDTASLAERVIELLSRSFLIEGQQINIGASIGITLLKPERPENADVLKHANLALYAAKAAGRSTFRIFEQRLAEQALERREMELNLRRALGLQELSLFYQPQVNLQTQAISGFEALLRWNCAKCGPISPADFIPLAEEIGEIHTIGEWVLYAACQEASTWPNDLIVAVNVSPLQFNDDRIVTIVHDALRSAGLAPARLELEITEGTLISNSPAVMQRLWALKAMGVGIAMDDFGTGYSSLSYLNSFPFSKLKIDQSFIRGEQSVKSKALVDAILALATSLGMTTIAEGVETQAQFEALARSGCDNAQGYLIARPMPPEQINDYFQRCGCPAKTPAPATAPPHE
ncbi:putative bifunctional diguanylate cyclase/phosphodiesterase [Phytohalomonas tamaricis]|uniref:putative bifunctional diguanylate cyclase/phosphodiesterase n=1 Tax=Phytohalomonas tamaricis TaxID=2081032 RepID=UPI001319D602|nr:EAL domain-containing protein [Phytohalomonas tamaricis]